jgi:hypothetical protein
MNQTTYKGPDHPHLHHEMLKKTTLEESSSLKSMQTCFTREKNKQEQIPSQTKVGQQKQQQPETETERQRDREILQNGNQTAQVRKKLTRRREIPQRRPQPEPLFQKAKKMLHQNEQQQQQQRRRLHLITPKRYCKS